MAKLRKGHLVQVWDDPITKLRPIGQATLLEFECDEGNGLERWTLCFPGGD